MLTATGETFGVAPFSECVGCAVSQSGSRMAVTLDSGDGAIVDFATKSMTTPFWFESATFLADETKLVIAQQHQLYFVSDAGEVMQQIPAAWASEPTMSPNDAMLAYVDDGAIVIRNYRMQFSEASTVVVPREENVINASPSFSPDNQWLAYTRITTGSTGEQLASIWVVRVDGSSAPVQVTTPTADSALVARWAPFQHSFSEQPVMFLTFDAEWLMGRRQIWMAAFMPQTGTARAPLRLPFQASTTSNRVAHWAKQMVR
jgi:hypothetical protein